MTLEHPRLRDRPVLVAVAVGLAMAETAALVLFGPHNTAALAPQVSAPAPFDVFHDLRWLAVYVPSWVAFAIAMLSFIAFRTGVTFVFVRHAWPYDVDRPTRRELVVRCLVSTIVLTVLVIPWVVLIFATAVFSLSWTWIVAFPAVIMLSVVAHHVAITPEWWRSPVRFGSVGPVLAAVAVLTLAGAVIAVGDASVQMLAAAAAGLVNAWAWLRITHAVAGQPRIASSWPVPLIALVGVVALVVSGTAIGFAVATSLERGRPSLPRVSGRATGPPVLVVKGFNSQWDGITRRWVAGHFDIRRFSYAGLDAHGRPRAYAREATHRSVRASARVLRTQIGLVHAETGRSVGIVAESEGALVALTYLLATPDAPVSSIVVLSPLAGPGRVSYPEPGRAGWGIVAGAALDATGAVLDALSPVDVRSDAPLFRSIIEQAPLFQALLRCRVDGVRELAVLPVDTGLAAPELGAVRVPYVVRPAFHGGLLGDDVTQRLTQRVLRGRAIDTGSAWRTSAHVIQALAAPWQAPRLAKSLEPAWRQLPDSEDCPAVRRALRSYLGD